MFGFLFIPVASLLMTAGLILPATPSYAAVTVYQIVSLDGTCIGSNASHQSETVNCGNGGPGSSWHINAQVTLNGKKYNQWENNNNLCLGLSGGTGPQLVAETCGPTTDHAQFWWGPSLSVATYTNIKNGHTGLCADGSAFVGHLITETTCDSSPGEEWNGN